MTRPLGYPVRELTSRQIIENYQASLISKEDIEERKSHMAQLLFQSVRDGDDETVFEILESGFDVNAKDENGNSALHIAVDYGLMEIINMLIFAFNADLDIENKQHQTPLEIAAIYFVRGINEYLEVIKNLVEIGGASAESLVEQVCGIDKFEPLLSWVIKNNFQNILRGIVEHAPDEAIFENIFTSNRNTLHLIAIKGDKETTDIVLAKFNDNVKGGILRREFIDQQDENSLSALCLATYHGHLHVVDGLLKSGADVLKRDGADRSVLKTAISVTVLAMRGIESKLDPEPESSVENRIRVISLLVKNLSEKKGDYLADLYFALTKEEEFQKPPKDLLSKMQAMSKDDGDIKHAYNILSSLHLKSAQKREGRVGASAMGASSTNPRVSSPLKSSSLAQEH